MVEFSTLKSAIKYNRFIDVWKFLPHNIIFGVTVFAFETEFAIYWKDQEFLYEIHSALNTKEHNGCRAG